MFSSRSFVVSYDPLYPRGPGCGPKGATSTWVWRREPGSSAQSSGSAHLPSRRLLRGSCRTGARQLARGSPSSLFRYGRRRLRWGSHRSWGDWVCCVGHYTLGVHAYILTFL